MLNRLYRTLSLAQRRLSLLVCFSSPSGQTGSGLAPGTLLLEQLATKAL